MFLSTVAQTLWSNPARNRFFLIPDDQELPPGDFALRTVIGRQEQFDPNALASFELMRNEANAWLNSQVDQVVGGARRAVNGYLTRKHDPVAIPPARAARPGVRLFSALTGETTEAIQTEPEASLRGLGKLGDDIKGLETTRPEPDPGEVFRDRLRVILEDVVSRLEDLADEVLPDSENEEPSSD